MAKETLGLKVDSEIAEQFKEFQAAAGGTAQDLLETLLSAYTQAQVDSDTASPVYKEQVKVRQAFAQAERVANAFLELAAADKITAGEQARNAVEAAQGKVLELDAKIKMDVEQIKNLQEENQGLVKQIAGFEEKTESLETLKMAWTEKESTLNSRIAELDAEAKQARELTKRVTDLEKELAQKNSALALADQQTKHDQEALKDVKIGLGEARVETAELRKKLVTAQQDLNTEKLECSSRINEVEKRAAEEKGRLTGELVSIKEQLISQKDSNKK